MRSVVIGGEILLLMLLACFHLTLSAINRPGTGSWELAMEQGKVRMKPFPSITNETYRLYQESV